MKFSLALIAAAAAVLVSAQDLSQLPSCSKSCAIQAMAATSCGATDIKCICTDKAFMVTIGPCVKTSCDTADQEKTIQFAVALCKNAGVTIPQSEIDSLTKSSEPSSSASHSTKAGTYASATPSSEEPTSTSTNSASSSVPSTGAASKLGVSGLGFGAAAAALFLL